MRTWLENRLAVWKEDCELHTYLGMSEDLLKKHFANPPAWTLGIDEAGCGCWAGPLVVGAVVAPFDWTHPSLRDSKEVKTEAGRARVLLKLRESPGARYYIHRTPVEVVDKLGIRGARVAAYTEVCERLHNAASPMMTVLDGDLGPKDFDIVLLTKADSFVPQVMAAAMIAKVARDTEMIELAKQYPQYGFERHKGYHSEEHVEALEKYGPCPLHRRSYRPIQKYSARSTSAPSAD